ncbi:protein of unknown function DUF134 [Thermodesulfobium narugense DSM 14796]|uniref:Uncharacterized protein n=1 Tax=Thermodesulfobium narugense DSM 14796 TaxID=747365 RepID=M1E9E6_9BACT|nr:DUF134 domain-containing protein [Thermodesulfobium narugense]AEE15144.1 protein of unknown function DUF134 [Thermodesulfobium narugense DSM 14796]
MPRPKLKRFIQMEPKYSVYAPKGVGKTKEEILMDLDEVETLRLVFGEGLDQDKAAKKLGVSRQTVGRTVDIAGKKLADFLVNGKVLKIKTDGNYEFINKDSNEESTK